MARKLIVEIVGDTRALENSFKKADDGASKFGKRFGTVAKGAGIAGLAIGGAVAVGLKAAIDSANQHALALNQTKAVLKSTGGAARVTAKHITGLADSIVKSTGVDDLATQAGENLLLTFTNLKNGVGKGNDIFDQTVGIMTDMSVALGQDTKSSAIQLGKALNDPVKGITALSRVGVSFTQKQKDQIKALVKSGDTMKAQKVILRELNKEFGGSAKAAGQTLPGQLNILKARLDDVAQKVGEKLVPALLKVVDFASKNLPKVIDKFNDVVAFVRKHWPEISKIISKVVEDRLGEDRADPRSDHQDRGRGDPPED